MKKILFITIFSFFLSFNISIAAEKKCANFKIFTPEHNKCVKEKTKSFTKKTKEFGKKEFRYCELLQGSMDDLDKGIRPNTVLNNFAIVSSKL
mgnify:CR=1 FL=1